MKLTLQSAFGWTNDEANMVVKLASILINSGTKLTTITTAIKSLSNNNDVTSSTNWGLYILDTIKTQVGTVISNTVATDNITDSIKTACGKAVAAGTVSVDESSAKTGSILDVYIFNENNDYLNTDILAKRALTDTYNANTYLKAYLPSK